MDTTIKYKNQVIRTIVLFLLLIIVFLFPYAILFDESNAVCIHHHLLGFQCPLCGMTRAVYQLMHLQFSSAVTYNFTVVFLPFYMGMDLATLFFEQNWLRVAKKIILAVIAAALVLLYAMRIYEHLYGI